MAHRREAVLARLLEIAQSIPGVRLALRNTRSISDSARPAIIILDGDESRRTGSSGRGPALMDMTPEIYVLRGGKPEDVGADLNALRTAFLKAALFDEALAGIIGANGEVVFEGTQTDLASGRTIAGNMGLSIRIAYPFIPSEL
jgi:hypothetical protein